MFKSTDNEFLTTALIYFYHDNFEEVGWGVLHEPSANAERALDLASQFGQQTIKVARYNLDTKRYEVT